MLPSWKRTCLALAAALAAALMNAAAAAAAPAPSPPQPLAAAVASRLGVAPDKLEAAVRAAELQRWNAFAAEHQVPQARAAAVRARIEHEPLTLVARFGRGRSPGMLRAAAAYLGLQPRQLMTELRQGRSMADVASAQGRSAAGLESALYSAAGSELDRRVQAGEVTAAGRDKMLAELKGRLGGIIHRRMPPRASGAGSGASGSGSGNAGRASSSSGNAGGASGSAGTSSNAGSSTGTRALSAG